MTTIRSLMLAQQARHALDGRTAAPILCNGCDLPWPCAERVAADAVLTTLDACDWQYDKQRLVPDTAQHVVQATTASLIGGVDVVKRKGTI